MAGEQQEQRPGGWKEPGEQWEDQKAGALWLELLQLEGESGARARWDPAGIVHV